MKVVGYICDFQILFQRSVLEATLGVPRKAMWVDHLFIIIDHLFISSSEVPLLFALYIDVPFKITYRKKYYRSKKKAHESLKAAILEDF